jgi:hypothetical protein
MSHSRLTHVEAKRQVNRTGSDPDSGGWTFLIAYEAHENLVAQQPASLSQLEMPIRSISRQGFVNPLEQIQPNKVLYLIPKNIHQFQFESLMKQV